MDRTLNKHPLAGADSSSYCFCLDLSFCGEGPEDRVTDESRGLWSSREDLQTRPRRHSACSRSNCSNPAKGKEGGQRRETCLSFDFRKPHPPPLFSTSSGEDSPIRRGRRRLRERTEEKKRSLARRRLASETDSGERAKGTQMLGEPRRFRPDPREEILPVPSRRKFAATRIRKIEERAFLKEEHEEEEEVSIGS